MLCHSVGKKSRDLPLREKFVQVLKDLAGNTQVILLEHADGIGDQLKPQIASTHKIEHKGSISNISVFS